MGHHLPWRKFCPAFYACTLPELGDQAEMTAIERKDRNVLFLDSEGGQDCRSLEGPPHVRA